MPDLVDGTPGAAPCISIWVTHIIVWDIVTIICQKNSWSSSLFLESVSDVIELRCMISCICLICSLDCSITSHRRGFFFVGPPDVPLFLFCLDVWVASLRSWCRTGAKMEGKSLFKARPAWDATGEVVIGQDDTSHGFGGANVRTKWRHNKDKPTLWWIYLGHRRICWKSRPCGPQRRSLENWNPGWEYPQAWLMRNSQSPG